MARFIAAHIVRTFLALAAVLSAGILPMTTAMAGTPSTPADGTPSAPAAGTISTISVVWVKSDSVRIRAYDFPAAQLFTVRMDKYGSQAANGTVVAVTNSGAGGSFEETYLLPAALTHETRLAIRMETSDGLALSSWFWTTYTAPTVTPTPSSTGAPAGVDVVAVKMDTALIFRTYNLPAYQNFRVRIGPFDNFINASVVVATFSSGSGGTLTVRVPLPDTLRSVSRAAIRLDGDQGRTVYNAFTNAPLGDVDNISANITFNPGGATVQYYCQVMSASPSGIIGRGLDFDAVWVIKNTGLFTWNPDVVDYMYESGTPIQKFDNLYDLPKPVTPDHELTIHVDMVAPKYAGMYTTTWSVRWGSTTLCRMPITITVR